MSPRYAAVVLVAPFLSLALVAGDSGRGDMPKGTLNIQATLKFTIDVSEPPKRLTLTALVPHDRPGQQKIVSVKYSQEPSEVIEEFGNKYAVFTLESPKKKTVISIDVEAELYPFDFKEIDKPRHEKAASLKRYLQHETYLECDCREIQEAAKVIHGKDDLDTLRGIMAFVVSMMKRGPYDRKDRGALYALQMREGDWTEFADLFVAMCRARGIPARVCEGYLPDKGVEQPRYQWVEAYTDKTGWLSFDPYQVSAAKATFDRMLPRLCLSTVRTDARLMYYHYWAYRYEGGRDVDVQSNYSVHWKAKP
jgi:transglutaminase-like putative cysteine protease